MKLFKDQEAFAMLEEMKRLAEDGNINAASEKSFQLSCFIAQPHVSMAAYRIISAKALNFWASR
tara:strand:+ start:257 stop:448 length:192 start_codon:yes stop_codon:yes gene_type:complete